MKTNSKRARGRSWKTERATVHRAGTPRPKSNKYSPSDSHARTGGKSRVWVGGYTRSDGTHVEGHYRQQAA